MVDQKQIIKKAKDRHIFLFELYLVFSKEVKDTNGKAKYIYKAKFLVSNNLHVWQLLPSLFLKENNNNKNWREKREMTKAHV